MSNTQRPAAIAPGVTGQMSQFTEEDLGLASTGAQYVSWNVEYSEDGVRTVKFTSGAGGPFPLILLPLQPNTINSCLQQGREILCGPLVGGEVGIARNRAGLQLGLTADGLLRDYEAGMVDTELLASAQSTEATQIEHAVAPGRFQVALLTPMPTTIVIFNVAPLSPPLFASQSNPSAAGELTVLGVAAPPAAEHNR